MTKKLVLFDLDGTLIDTLEDLGAAVDYALDLRGLPRLTLADYRKMVGHGVRNLVKQALEAALAQQAQGQQAQGQQAQKQQAQRQQAGAGSTDFAPDEGFLPHSGTDSPGFAPDNAISPHSGADSPGFAPDNAISPHSGADSPGFAPDNAISPHSGANDPDFAPDNAISPHSGAESTAFAPDEGFSPHSGADSPGFAPDGTYLQHSGANDPDFAPDDAYVDAALADFKAYYSAHIAVHTHPYDGIPELLEALQAKGVRMAVASNKFQEGTEHLVRTLFPTIDFVAILGNRPGLPLKPSPEIVEEVLRRSGLPREEAILVGDSPTDMATAANGGIDAIAVSWGYRTPDELAASRPTPESAPGPANSTPAPFRIVGSVAELRGLLVPFYVSEPVSTPPATFETPLQALIYRSFAEKGIPFERVDTDPGITMEDCRHIDARIGVRIVKTVFLCNRQQTEFYLYVTRDDKPFVTRDFCSALGIPRVSFASAEKLWDLTGVRVGATTILSAVFPAAERVHLVMDADIAAAEWFACTDGTPTCFVKLRTRDLLDRYLNGHPLQLLGR